MEDNDNPPKRKNNVLSIVTRTPVSEEDTTPTEQTSTLPKEAEDEDAAIKLFCTLTESDNYLIRVAEMIKGEFSWAKVVQRLQKEFADNALPNAAIRFFLLRPALTAADVMLAVEIMQPVLTYFKSNDVQLRLDVRKCLQITSVKLLERFFVRDDTQSVIIELMFLPGGVVLKAGTKNNKNEDHVVTHAYFGDSLFDTRTTD